MRRHLTSIFIAVAFVVAMCPKAGFGAVGDVAELAGVSVVQLVEDPGQPGRVYAATDQGVFVLPDETAHGTHSGTVLQESSVSSVACAPDGTRLMAATEQGLWELSEGQRVMVSGQRKSAGSHMSGGWQSSTTGAGVSWSCRGRRRI